MSGGVSIAHIAHEVCNPAKDAASLWWLDPTIVGQMASLQPEGDLRDHTHVIHLTFTHSFHLTLFTLVAPRPKQRHPSWTSLSNPSSASSSSVTLFPLPEERPLRNAGSSDSRGRPSGRPHWLLSVYIYPGGVLPSKPCPSGGPWRPDGVRRLQRSPSFLILQSKR